MVDSDQCWVFGYGSLMWRPGFPYEEVLPASLDGYRREMCIQSVRYRGTPDAPGLVCGLMPGGRCRGLAYRIHADKKESVIRYLDERELVNDVYLPCHVNLELEGGFRVKARTYVADTEHLQYAGAWSDTLKIKYLIQGYGKEGRSLDYLASIIEQLSHLGMVDEQLTQLLAKARVEDGKTLKDKTEKSFL